MAKPKAPKTTEEAILKAQVMGVKNNSLTNDQAMQRAENIGKQNGVVQPVIQPVTTPTLNKPAPVTLAAETQGNAILPESVTGIKPGSPVISPTLQAKIDAKKNGTAPGLNPNPKSVEERVADSRKTREEIARAENPGMDEAGIKQIVDKMTPEDEKKILDTLPPPKTNQDILKEQGQILADKPIGEQKQQEVSDVEKQAQATGVAYTMENGQATYNPKTTEEAVKILAMGGKLAGESKMTAVAQASLDKVRGFAQMTDQQLANNISLGKVSSKDLELLNQINPNLVAKAQEFSKKKVITDTTNEIMANNNAIVSGKEYNGVSKPLQELLNKLETIDADQRSPAEMKAQFEANNPGMVQSRDSINSLQTQKRGVEKAQRDLYDQVRAQYSGYPESAIMATYSTLSRQLNDQMYSINDNLNTEISNYNSYLDEMKTEMDWEIAQQGKEEQRLWDIYGVTSKEQIRQEDIIRKDQELKMAMEQAQSEQEYNQYKDERDFNFKVAESMQKSGHWEAEYGLKAADYDLKVQQAKIDAQKGNWSVKDGQLINADTGEMKPLQSFVGAQGLATPMVQNLLNQCRIEGQCGEGANDYLEKLGAGRLLGDSYTSKTEDINSSTPVIGSVAVWNPSGDGIGHAGIVLEDRGDKLLVRDWNYGLDEKQQEHEVPKANIARSGGGYIVPDKLKEMQIPEVQRTVLQGIKELEDHPGLNAAVGFGFQKLLPGNQAEEGFLPATDAEDFRVKFMSFRDNIVLPNLELLKGAMSDNDIKFIRSAGTAASLGMSEEAFKGELNRIANNIYEKFGLDKRAYSQDEEALIKKLVQQGATDADIDQALTLYRK